MNKALDGFNYKTIDSILERLLDQLRDQGNVGRLNEQSLIAQQGLTPSESERGQNERQK
jgi:hypothetical protein